MDQDWKERQKYLGLRERVVASSGFGDSDIDVFIYGLTEAEATQKLEELVTTLGGEVREA